MKETSANAVLLGFEGPYDEAFALVDELRTGGLRVSWEPPDRERGGIVHDIIVGLIVSGALESVKIIVSNFVQRHRAKVSIEQKESPEVDPGDPGRTS